MAITATVIGTISTKRVLTVDFDIDGKVCRYDFQNRPDNHPTLGTLQQQANQSEIDCKDQWSEWTTHPAPEGATIVSQVFEKNESGLDWYNLVIQWPITDGAAQITGIQVDVPAGLSTEDEQAVIDAAAAQAVTAFFVSKNIFDA
jgi:hypothetical protein